MKAHYTKLFIIISLLTLINGAKSNRRILHQPLFPVDAPPPPLPPPTPEPPEQENQPFSNEINPDYSPPPLALTGTAVATPSTATPPPPNSIRKLAIAISSTLVTIGMLFAVGYFMYKNRHEDSQKFVGEESRPPPPVFLCVETAEPSTTELLQEGDFGSGSTYQKLKGKGLDHYRPSPDLQPLQKPPPPPRMSSPPPMSSSDDESHDARPSIPQSTSNKTSRPKLENPPSKPVPHSKRTPPKSRFSTPSPPSIKQSWPPSPPPPTTSLGPFQSCKQLMFSPKISVSPPSQGMQQRHSMSIYELKAPPHPPIPPPPPPPPPPSSMTRKYAPAKAYNPPARRSESKSPSPRASPSVKEANKGENSSRIFDSRPKMKALHWDKVQSTADRATVWDHLESTSFQLNEGAMESLFGCNSVTPLARETTRKFVLPCKEQEKRILDSKKSQNIAILLRALNVTREEVSEALLEGNPEGLGPELFETLVKMAPSKEEEIKLREYNGNISKLGPPERFLKAILDIPLAFKRVEALLYKENFNNEVKYLRKSFQTLEEASEELKNSHLFLKLLEAVLRTGNHMNGGTNRGDAKAFKLDTLLKLVDIKGKDGKTTLLHFVVQEVIRSEGASVETRSESWPRKHEFKFNQEDFKNKGLLVVAGLSKELANIKKAAGMDSDVLSSYVSKLELGLHTVRQVVQYENDKFVETMKVFLEEAIDEISRVKAEERKALSLVREVTQYFHGDDAKREAHPLRIFVVVRDFLSILDNVCKDVGRMQDRAAMGSGRSFRISGAVPLPVLKRFSMQSDRSSDDESM